MVSITIGESVKSIGKNAFSGCSSLKFITIGESVESIGENAFSGCRKNMKKTYTQPQVLVAQIVTTSIICGSKDIHATVNGDTLGYGGMDGEGEMEPAARRRRDVWDEEEEEW